MSSTRPTQSAQRAASEAALLDAAVELYATHGPDGAPLRDLAKAAGLTHAMVARYFGSKQGLVSAVEGRLAAEITTVTDGIEFTNGESCVKLLGLDQAPRRAPPPTWPCLSSPVGSRRLGPHRRNRPSNSSTAWLAMD